MWPAVTVRLLALVSVVALSGGTATGQSSSPSPTKAGQKRASARNAAATEPKPADVRIRTKYTSGAQVSENVTYVKGRRHRVEFPGVVSIEQCDLGQTLVINPAAKTYYVTRHVDVTAAAAATSAGPGAAAPEATVSTQLPEKPTRGGIVTYTTTVNDAGDRKQVFGREARHIRTTMTKSANASACDKTPLTVEVDGWYVDFPAIAQCSVAPPAPRVTAHRGDACVDEVESRTSGDATLAFPVSMKTTTMAGEGDKQEVDTSSMEVISFEVTTLDASLFTVPPGYTEVKSGADLVASFKRGSSGLSDALGGSTADGTSAAAAKRDGAVRIGVLEPVDKSTHQLPTQELRQQLAAGFRKAPFEALALSGSSVADAQGEAAKTECDYLLYSEITDIRTSKPGKVGGMFKKVRGGGPARDVHEVKLDYRLYRVGAASTSPAFSDSTSASSGGGFGLRSVVRLAMFAGSLYLQFSGLALLNPALMSSLGGGLGPFGGGGLVDPRMSAVSSVSQMFGPAGMDAAGDNAGIEPEVEIRRTVEGALTNAAKGTMEQLKKSAKQREVAR